MPRFTKNVLLFLSKHTNRQKQIPRRRLLIFSFYDLLQILSLFLSTLNEGGGKIFFFFTMTFYLRKAWAAFRKKGYKSTSMETTLKDFRLNYEQRGSTYVLSVCCNVQKKHNFVAMVRVFFINVLDCHCFCGLFKGDCSLVVGSDAALTC